MSVSLSLCLSMCVGRVRTQENGKSCMDLAEGGPNPMTVRLLRNFRPHRSEAAKSAKSKSQLKMEQIVARRAARTEAEAKAGAPEL